MDLGIQKALDLIGHQLTASNLPSDKIYDAVISEMRRASNPLLGAALALYALANPEPARDGSSLVWLNGEFRPLEACTMPLNSPTVHYGRGAFEGIFGILHEGELLCFRLADHFERFLLTAKTLGLDCPFNVEQLCQATIDTLLKNNMHKALENPQYKIAYIRPLLYRDSSKLAGIEISSGPVGVALEVFPWGSYVKDEHLTVKTFEAPALYGETFAAMKATGKYNVSHAVKLMLAAINTHSEVQYNEGLLINSYNGNLIELSAENVCVLTSDGRLLTPDKGALKGITLDTVCSLAPRLGFKPEHVDITMDSLRGLKGSQEVVCIFACGTAAGLKRIARIDDWNLDTEKSRVEFTLFDGMYKSIIRGLEPESGKWVTRIPRPT